VNLVLLFETDFIIAGRVVQLTGRRRDHITSVHRAEVGDELVVGLAGGRIGRGRVIRRDEAVEMEVSFDSDPPAPPPLTLVLALPRPKVLNRVIAAVTSLGVKRLFLINAWRVEKSYWRSPRISPQNIAAQCVLGLEQGRDTVMPVVELRRFFRSFVEEELPALARGTTALVAHPAAAAECPRHVGGEITLAVGPEGGFIAEEIASLERAGLRPVSFGPRILRVETAVAALAGRLL
jgi:RsmE family RNA methyltransferase